MDRNDLNLLERLIDKYSLVEVIDGLETICIEKAEHIAHNWQDVTLANQWMLQSTLLKVLNAGLKEGTK